MSAAKTMHEPRSMSRTSVKGELPFRHYSRGHQQPAKEGSTGAARCLVGFSVEISSPRTVNKNNATHMVQEGPWQPAFLTSDL